MRPIVEQPTKIDTFEQIIAEGVFLTWRYLSLDTKSHASGEHGPDIYVDAHLIP